MDSPFKLFGKKPVIGRVSETSLRARKRISYRNSFQPHLLATTTEEFGQTRLKCRIGMHPFAIAFMTLWFGFLIVGCLVEVGTLIAHGAPPLTAQSIGLAIPFGMILFGIFLLKFCAYLARGEQQFLIDIVCKTIDAKIIESN